MSEQDLSLLTDEESAIVARYEPEPNLHHHQEYLAARHNVNLLANALIAARAENKQLLQDLLNTREWAKIFLAENKRKDDLLRRLEWSGGYWDSVSDTMLSTCPVCSAPENHGMVHSDGCELSALLQSEKGGE